MNIEDLPLTFILRPIEESPSRRNCWEAIKDLPDGIVVEIKEETRSIEQNRLMWPILTLWEKFQKACVNGQMIPISANGWKNIHLADFQREEGEASQFVLTPRGLLMPLETKTSVMGKRKFARLLTYLLAETGDRGMELPPRTREECIGYIRKYSKSEPTGRIAA